MKNLANCKPSEFLMQTNKIRKSVEKWVRLTDLKNIRNRMPAYEEIEAGMSVESRAEIEKRNLDAKRKQAMENLSAMLDEMLEKHPKETIEILALCCFVEPEAAENHSMIEYLGAINELLGSKEVIDFFILLARLGQTNI